MVEADRGKMHIGRQRNHICNVITLMYLIIFNIVVLRIVGVSYRRSIACIVS